MTRVVVLVNNLRRDLQALEDAATGFHVAFATDEEAMQRLVPDAEILLGWRPGAEKYCLQPGSALKWVQLYSAGVDGVPLQQLASKGVLVTTASGVHARPISETAFGLLLALVRGILPSVRNQQWNEWKKPDEFREIGEIHNKTLGILGAGHIGRECAAVAKGFSMRVLGLRNSGGQEPGFEAMYKPDELPALLSQCDVVMNILPLTDDTRGMINAGAFEAMKQDALYISVGRGATTDSAALLHALQSKKLAGAGLDVTDPEPLPPDSPLWDLPNVIITPHIAGNTRYYNSRLLQIFEENLHCYACGEKPCRNLVDVKIGY